MHKEDEEEDEGYKGCSEPHHWEHEDKGAMMMCLVMEAKMELLKEKMKKKLEAVEGKKLDEIANLLVDAKMNFHKAKAEMMMKREEMREKLESVYERKREDHKEYRIMNIEFVIQKRSPI